MQQIQWFTMFCLLSAAFLNNKFSYVNDKISTWLLQKRLVYRSVISMVKFGLKGPCGLFCKQVILPLSVSYWTHWGLINVFNAFPSNIPENICRGEFETCNVNIHVCSLAVFLFLAFVGTFCISSLVTTNNDRAWYVLVRMCRIITKPTKCCCIALLVVKTSTGCL